VTTDTDGLEIAGTGAVALTAAPVVAASKLLTVSNSEGVTLDAGINVLTVAGGLTIADGGKVILPSGQAITAGADGTVTGGEWSIGAAAGTATADGDIILTDAGISGSAAKLSLDYSGILVGLTETDSIGATFDGVDIYLAGNAAYVKIQSSATGTYTTTLTLANNAKISGLTGANSTVTDAAVTAIVTESDGATGGISNIAATTAATGSADAGNYLTGSDSGGGTIAATASDGAKNYLINIASIATANGTAG
jgi:hypothetical protein